MIENENMPEAPQEALQEAQEQAAQEPALARAQEAMAAEIRQLYEDGWEIEQLEAMAGDEQVKSALADGASIRQAATAFMMRRTDAGRSLPSMRTGTSGAAAYGGRVAQMSDAEFARFSDEAYQRLMAGEKIRL